MLRLLKNFETNAEAVLPDEVVESAKSLEMLDETLTAEFSSKAPARALLVGSERGSLKWGPRFLKRLGFEVDLATSGTRARFFLDAKEPNVVIVEAGLREVNGMRVYRSLLERLGEAGPSVMVIGAGRAEAKRALACGAADVCRRPNDWNITSRRAALIAASRRSAQGVDRARQAVDRALAELAGTRELLERKAEVDGLTELPNRKVFLALLEKAFSVPRPLGSATAVLYIDVDDFGTINESAGRASGDEILKQMAGRLTGCFESAELMAVRTSGLVSASLARLGGDEFALMITNVSSPEHLNPLFERISRELADAFDVDGSKYFVSASFGGAMHPTDGQTAEEVLHHAELAMLEAKDLGGGVLCFYDQSLNEKANKRVTLGRDLRRALERDELRLHYQPLLDIKTGRVVAVEALLRWEHPERGLLLPGKFLSVAEAEALMLPIGRWVLQESCRQLREWMDAGLPRIRMSVNVAHRQLTHGDLLQEVLAALSTTRIEPQQLEIELSERGFLGRTSGIPVVLKSLRKLGVRVAIDDFGTGDSAIVYLRQLPIDSLKIDRSYVSGGGDPADNRAMGPAMVAMAHGLNLKVVAEGVETNEQMRLVEEWGCDEVQGFLFSRARPANQVPELLSELSDREFATADGETK